MALIPTGNSRDNILGYGLASLGLAGVTTSTTSITLEVWILSSNLTKPIKRMGIWDDAALWIDTNKWWD